MSYCEEIHPDSDDAMDSDTAPDRFAAQREGAEDDPRADRTQGLRHWLAVVDHAVRNNHHEDRLTERYPNSIRFVVNIHAFRSYFHTKASQKHGVEYANALDGHGAYLKQYYREDPKERAAKYLTLEPSLLVESVKVQADNTKDKIIETLESQMEELQNKMKRFELLNQ